MLDVHKEERGFAPRWEKWALVVLVVSVFSLMLQSCGRKVAPEESCDFVQNASGLRVSWKGRLPIRFSVHESVPEVAYKAIEEAAAEYNRKLGKLVIQIDVWGAGGPKTPERDGVNIIYWMESWETGQQSEQARTTIFWSGKQIYDADIRLNSANFDFHTSVSTPVRGVDLISLLVHEFGHALGLGHVNHEESIMVTSLPSGVSRREVSMKDLTSLACEY